MWRHAGSPELLGQEIDPRHGYNILNDNAPLRNDLERYCLGMIPEGPEVDALEEHLLNLRKMCGTDPGQRCLYRQDSGCVGEGRFWFAIVASRQGRQMTKWD